MHIAVFNMLMCDVTEKCPGIVNGIRDDGC